MRTLLLICLAWIGLGVPGVLAQRPDADVLPTPLPRQVPPRFEHLTLEDGLSQSLVYRVYQDRQGFMWFGTQDGLNRYDGHTFTVYRSAPFDSTSLLDNWVSSILEDRNGALWVGTSGGLNRMDPDRPGRFTRYVHDRDDSTSVVPGVIFVLFEDRAGTLWLGSRTGGGLGRMDPDAPGRFTRYAFDPADPHSLSNNFVHAVHQDPSGALWVATANGLNRMDPARPGHFTRYLTGERKVGQTDPNFVFTGMADDPAAPGVLWAGSANGLVRFDPSTGEVQRYLAVEAGSPPSVVMNVAPDPATPGVLWAARNGGGLVRFDTRTGESATYRHDPQDARGLLGDEIWQVYADQSGTVWTGGAGGVSRFSPGTSAFLTYRHVPGAANTLPAGNVWAVLEDAAGALWVGIGVNTFNGAGLLERIDRETGEVTHLRHDPSDPQSLLPGAVWSLFQDRSGTLWAGTAAGLNRMDAAADGARPARFTRYPVRPGAPQSLPGWGVYPIYEDRSGTLWVGTGNGLSRMDDARTGRFTSYRPDPEDSTALRGGRVRAILEAADGTLWVGTSGGLNRMDRAAGTFTHFGYDPADPGGLNDEDLYALYERAEEPGVLWIGTREGGLNRFDTRAGTATHFTTRDGLPNNFVYTILGDEDGRLWLSTNNGLACFDPATRTFRNFDTDSGLSSREFNQNAAYRSPTGELFFGGIDGVTAFFPQQLQPNPHPPSVVLTGLRLFNRPVDVGDGGPLPRPLAALDAVRLAHDQNVVTFDFVALHYQNPSKNAYAYRLDGFDRDWVPAGTQHAATYTNLDPGTYTFHVRAANADGVWSERGASVQLVILPPWWRTAWAYVFYALLLAAAVFAVDRVQRRRVIGQERARALLREKELRAEAAEARALLLQADNERKTQELEAARTLQLSMLPERVPQLPGLRVAAYMKTATEVGGDYYDFDVADDGTLTFAIGDATGHGAQAGTMVTATKSLFNVFAREDDLAYMLRTSSKALKRMQMRRLFMALAVGKLRGRAVELVGAGMPPALLRRAATGQVEEVPLKGMPLGSFPDFPYAKQQVRLETGDTLVLLSDGLPELFDASGAMFGYDRAAHLLAEAGDADPDAVVATLVQAAEAWSGNRPPDDDMTFVVLQAV